MPYRNSLAGLAPQQMAAVLGVYVGVSLIVVASGTAQLGYTVQGDDTLVTAANAGNTALTLPNSAISTVNANPINPGDFILITNGNTGQACVIFPFTGGVINNLGANASIALAVNTILRCKCTGANTWTVN